MEAVRTDFVKWHIRYGRSASEVGYSAKTIVELLYSLKDYSFVKRVCLVSRAGCCWLWLVLSGSIWLSAHWVRAVTIDQSKWIRGVASLLGCPVNRFQFSWEGITGRSLMIAPFCLGNLVVWKSSFDSLSAIHRRPMTKTAERSAQVKFRLHGGLSGSPHMLYWHGII